MRIKVISNALQRRLSNGSQESSEHAVANSVIAVYNEKLSSNSESVEHSHAMLLYDGTLSTKRGSSSMDRPLRPVEVEQTVKVEDGTGQDIPLEVCVPQMVAAWAAAAPGRVALVAGEETLSYQELNRRANQLAHYLRARGVGPNVLVGLCIERSPDMVVGLLGILKAGGAYVPLDPGYPPERLCFMIRDARMPVLVTRQALLTGACLDVEEHTHIICLDAGAERLAQRPANDPAATVTVDDLAYVIYTSGSTGRPKGTLISHKNLLNLVLWHQQAFAVTASDRATQVASLAFDAAGWELWPYLTAGASIYLPDEETRVTPVLLRDWLVERKISISFLPTALAESVMTLEWPRATALRFLLTGADALHRYPSPDLPFALINNYGPTEATVVATSGRVPPKASPGGEPPSIGRPIANTQIYILDENLREVPAGAAGELYIGGAGVAPGYLNRPALTAERFIADPFSDEVGARLYRTGDLARYLADGQIAFLGRTDQQIKIRGYRIEPGEIVTTLNGHPTVQTSLIVAREDTPGDRRLVAYIVPRPGARLNTNSLREVLRDHLPDHMIPAAFVLLEALPVTPNGKVDRAALPAPGSANTVCDGDEAGAGPATPTEARLAEIVRALLGLQRVGRDDNFFMLGGHSLLGTQLIVWIGETFGVDLTLRSLFNAPTVRQLAFEVERLIAVRLEALSDDEVLRLLEQAGGNSSFL